MNDGTFEPGLFALQVFLSGAGAAIAMRIIDDLKHWAEVRARRSAPEDA